MTSSVSHILEQLYREHTGASPAHIRPLPASGSSRRYFRITGTKTMVGAYHEDHKENDAFVHFAKHFKKEGLPVPEIYIYNREKGAYLQEDLGDTTLFSLIQRESKGEAGFSPRLINLYKQVLEWLPRFQATAGHNLNYAYCYPRSSFDQQSMLWDLNYFKYYFLKLAGIPFHEEKLEEDFRTFIRFLSQPKSHYFMYRDFQSRNIMIHGHQASFIDFQGGRKGPLQYDVASLLFDAKANIPWSLRQELLDHYIHQLTQWVSKEEAASFRTYYYGFVMIRIMQAMGAYGYRGFFEGKKHFLQSIPYAIANLQRVLDENPVPERIPELEYVLRAITRSDRLQKISEKKDQLTVEVNSFSYKRGIPADHSGHGGGFVFDCRALPNPGREQAYRSLTGCHQPVINFLKDIPEVQHFLDHTSALVKQSVRNYLERGFGHLSVSYGCTGGRHRSVYCASYLAEKLKNELDVRVELKHREQFPPEGSNPPG